MAKKGTLRISSSILKYANKVFNSKITNNDRPPHFHGHDRLLQNNDPTTNPSAPEYAQIRPRGEEKGPLPGSYEGWKGKVIPILCDIRWLRLRLGMGVNM